MATMSVTKCLAGALTDPGKENIATIWDTPGGTPPKKAPRGFETLGNVSTTLDLEETFFLRSGREPTNEEIMEYLERHHLQHFLTDVIMCVARHMPPDPFEFLLDHLEALVQRHRESYGKAAPADLKVGSRISSPLVKLEPPDVSPEQRAKIVRQVATVLGREGVLRASATSLYRRFADRASDDLDTGGGQGRMSKDGFDKLCKELEVTWGTAPEDSLLMCSVLQRWRFRTNTSGGTRGLPLWPLSCEDFVAAYPSLLRALRDRYVPIGGALHKSLFIRQTAGVVTDRYEVGQRLGRGAFGEVLLLSLKSDKAVKRVCKRVSRAQQSVPAEELATEIDLLRSMDHPHIIRLFEYFEEDDYLDMIMEPVFGGTLTNLINGLFCDEDGTHLGSRPEALTESWVATAISQLLSALAYAHDVVGVIHKDLKSDNVLLVGPPKLAPQQLLKERVHIMLADFGIAEIFKGSALSDPLELYEGPPGYSVEPSLVRSRSGSRSVARSARVGGTPSYMSPEMFQGSFTEKCDIWSLGVIVFQLLSGELPYHGSNVLIQANIVCNPRRHPNWDLLSKYRWSIGARWFCQQLLAKEEAMRPTAAIALHDTWLTKVRQAVSNQLPTESERSSLSGQHLQSHLAKMALHCMTSQLNLSQLHHLNLRFKHYDTTGDGRLSHVEMRQVLEDVGIAPGVDMELILESMDTNQSGMIEYSEFIASCIDFGNQSVRDQLRVAFDVFDLDGSGTISLNELRQVLTSGANPIVTSKGGSSRPPTTSAAAPAPDMVLPDGKTAEQVMMDLDANGTNMVEFHEFERYLLGEHARIGKELNDDKTQQKLGN